MADFNIQEFLQDMRTELNARHDLINGKLDVYATALHAHQIDDLKALAALETRLGTIERYQVAFRRVLWTASAAIGTFVLDLARNHIPHWFH